MKGLLLKEFYMVMKYCRTFVMIIAVFIVISCVGNESAFFIIYPSIFAGMIPVTLISYDERDKWNIYSKTLPYSRSQLVSAKYAIGLIFEVVVFILSAVAQAIRMYTTGAFEVTEYVSLMSSIFTIGIIAPAILLPFIFRLGSEKGRIVYYILIGMLAVLTTMMMGVDTPNIGNANLSWFPVIGCVVAAILYAVSWRLSILFYRKCEL